MPRGGKREGAGRPKGSPNKETKGRVTATKSVSLPTEDWEALAILGEQSKPPVTATKYAQAVLKNHIENYMSEL